MIRHNCSLGYGAACNGKDAISRMSTRHTQKHIRNAVPVLLSEGNLVVEYRTIPIRSSLCCVPRSGRDIEAGTDKFTVHVLSNTLRRRSRKRMRPVLYCWALKWAIVIKSEGLEYTAEQRLCR
ncbi:hypothetical protein ABIE33_007101 [Ensifer sp. 4252]